MMNEHDFSSALVALLAEIGEDPTREGLARTPARVWESIHYMTRGCREDLNTLMDGAVFPEDSRDMILLRDIDFTSLCEHHMLPFFGTVHVGYRPEGQIIGLSKIVRVVDHFACRLQVQERLTAQIADALFDALKPRALAVSMSAMHMCMAARGVQKYDSRVISSAFRGEPCEIEDFRPEFLAGIGKTDE